jgi:hypothetical protein
MFKILDCYSEMDRIRMFYEGWRKTTKNSRAVGAFTGILSTSESVTWQEQSRNGTDEISNCEMVFISVVPWNRFVTCGRADRHCKGEATPASKHKVMKESRGSASTAPCIINIATRWKWVVSFTLQPLCSQRKCLAVWKTKESHLGYPFHK